tara:strand:+ start:206 stop:874 length:669 start_codon:yes stop_codon:yes gene_type:complete
LKEIHILNLGVMNYSAVFDLMKELQRKRIDGEISDKLIFVEHEEVVTLGPKAKREKTSVDDYPTFETDRGGGVTWHGPGQLVVYPIIKWEGDMQNVRAVTGALEDWAVAALADCGISSYKDEAMQGVWVDGYKVCSIGLSFLKWVSRHGMSINVNTPGDRVEGLSGCGLEEGVHTCLNKLGYMEDIDGLTIDTKRIQKAFISTCDIALRRSPVLEYLGEGDS